MVLGHFSRDVDQSQESMFYYAPTIPLCNYEMLRWDLLRVRKTIEMLLLGAR